MLLRFPRLVYLMKADWDESMHPRADNGQFGSGSGGSKKPKPSKTKRKMERRAQAAGQGKLGGGAIQTLLSGGSALDKIGWLKTPEKQPEPTKKPEAKPEKPKAPSKPEQIRRAHNKLAGVLRDTFVDSWGDKMLTSYEASVLDFLSEQRDSKKPLTENQTRFFSKLAHEGAKMRPELAANYLSEKVLEQIGLQHQPSFLETTKPKEPAPKPKQGPKAEGKPRIPLADQATKLKLKELKALPLGKLRNMQASLQRHPKVNNPAYLEGKKYDNALRMVEGAIYSKV